MPISQELSEQLDQFRNTVSRCESELGKIPGAEDCWVKVDDNSALVFVKLDGEYRLCLADTNYDEPIWESATPLVEFRINKRLEAGCFIPQLFQEAEANVNSFCGEFEKLNESLEIMLQ